MPPRLRVSSRLATFRDQKAFTDCRLTSSEGLEFFCHRIVLAKYSTWFRQYFTEHSEPGKVTEVKIPMDPKGRFKDVIEFLYKGFLHFSLESIVDYLSIAEFYGIELLEMVAKDQLESALQNGKFNIQLVLSISKRLTQVGLSRHALRLAPQIATELAAVRNNRAAVQRIFNAISPEMLALIFQHERFAKLKPIERGRIADMYVGDRVLTEEERRHISMFVTDWSDESAYQVLVQNKCQWATADLVRRHYSRIIDTMRKNLAGLKHEVARSEEGFGKWCAYSWIHFIQLAIPTNETPIVNSVELARTLGVGYEVDPVCVGMLSCSSSEPISPKFEARYALFDNKNYFLSTVKHKNGKPFMRVDFGPRSKLLLHAIEINCSAKSRQNVPRMLPGPLTFTGVSEDGVTEVIIADVEYGSLPDLPHGKGKLISGFHVKNKYRCITITEVQSQICDFDVLRILDIEFRGQFVP